MLLTKINNKLKEKQNKTKITKSLYYHKIMKKEAKLE